MNATVNEIEREIEAGRARLDGVLNQLQDRLHPVAFVEDVRSATAAGAARRSWHGDLYKLSLMLFCGVNSTARADLCRGEHASGTGQTSCEDISWQSLIGFGCRKKSASAGVSVRGSTRGSI